MGVDTIIDMVKRIKPLMGVRFPQGVHKCWVRIGGQFIRLSI
jgi:hypothetical protein